MTFDSAESKKLRSTIATFVRKTENVKNYHAVYFDRKNSTIYCDLIVDYKLKSWDDLRESFLAYMKEQYPDCSVELTV